MGFEYALVHLKYTIPPAIALTLAYRPLLRAIDLYKIGFLITIAVVATIPWDSYLIRHRVWTYPPNVVVGPTLWNIPAEEVFFFVIQTYNTTLLYLLLSKPVVFAQYLLPRLDDDETETERDHLRAVRSRGVVLWLGLIGSGAHLARGGGEGTYLGLILIWAGPFALLLWTLAYPFLVRLPLTTTLLPIALPTIYLWIVDTLALRRGTWTIESGTKLGWHLWPGLEMEEAVFFLATNVLIVFGQVAFDHAYAVLLIFPHRFPVVPRLPSPWLLMRALCTPVEGYEVDRVRGVQDAVRRLQLKSRSFYLASSVFTGRLRIDLILLYSFCRVADDLVDNAATVTEARAWTEKLTKFLDVAYASEEAKLVSKQPDLYTFITDNFPASAHLALRLLPTGILPCGPLYELLEGFRTDLEFTSKSRNKRSTTTTTITDDDDDEKSYPIATEHDLEVYASRVAGTVAELCLQLVFYHDTATHDAPNARTTTDTNTPPTRRDHLIRAGSRMGIALQYVNIARDIQTDASINRVYLPTTWLHQVNLTAADILAHPNSSAVTERLRNKLLSLAFDIYDEARPALGGLPPDARAPMRVAIESYMEIGRVLRGDDETRYVVKKGRATVPKMRRLRVAWRALSEG